ncbi:MAG: hypothetical protein WBL20_14410 [Sphingobium sp.]|uniref:hypothetical protein n=1 Tax=Sphingobium sp. TaxID=1912891 RepID=UPI002E1DD7ED
MTDGIFIHFDRDQGKVKSFSTVSGAKATKLTIVLELTDSYALSRVLQELHEAQHPPPPPTTPPHKARSTPLSRAALPAPHLGLPYYGDDA